MADDSTATPTDQPSDGRAGHRRGPRSRPETFRPKSRRHCGRRTRRPRRFDSGSRSSRTGTSRRPRSRRNGSRLWRPKDFARAEALRLRVASKFGIGDEDADLFLTGSDEETLTKQAERLAAREPTARSPATTCPARATTHICSRRQATSAVRSALFQRRITPKGECGCGRSRNVQHHPAEEHRGRPVGEGADRLRRRRPLRAPSRMQFGDTTHDVQHPAARRVRR
jgi:hypothetical protein